MSTKYLTQEQLSFEIDFETIVPVSTDSYVEEEVKKSVESGNLEELFACALQFAIVGCGNRTYGHVKIHDVDYSVQDLMDKNNVKYALPLNAKLEPGELTLKRLARLFRFKISEYIEHTGNKSFLYLKYAEVGEPRYVFPGAEYMVTEANYEGINNAYQAMDAVMNTHFYGRLQLIYRARKIRAGTAR